jgi:hypothetical protein
VNVAVLATGKSRTRSSAYHGDVVAKQVTVGVVSFGTVLVTAEADYFDLRTDFLISPRLKRQVDQQSWNCVAVDGR